MTRWLLQKKKSLIIYMNIIILTTDFKISLLAYCYCWLKIENVKIELLLLKSSNNWYEQSLESSL